MSRALGKFLRRIADRVDPPNMEPLFAEIEAALEHAVAGDTARRQGVSRD